MIPRPQTPPNRHLVPRPTSCWPATDPQTDRRNLRQVPLVASECRHDHDSRPCTTHLPKERYSTPIRRPDGRPFRASVIRQLDRRSAIHRPDIDVEVIARFTFPCERELIAVRREGRVKFEPPVTRDWNDLDLCLSPHRVGSLRPAAHPDCNTDDYKRRRGQPHTPRPGSLRSWPRFVCCCQRFERTR